MRHGWRRCAQWVLLASLGCEKAPTVEPVAGPEPAVRRPLERETSDAREPEQCETARCWAKLAEARRSEGVEDAAAAYLGRAHASEPAEASLRAWLEALAATGQQRRLALALAEAEEQHPELVAELRAKAGTPGTDRAIAPGEPSGAVRTALVAELDGRIDEAIEGLRASSEPADRVRLGELLWRRGDRAEARRAWAAARIEIDERGARMRMVAVERWYTEGMLWSGDRLVLIRGWRPVDYAEQMHATELQHWSVGARAELVRSVVLPGDTGAVVRSQDGERLLGATAEGLDVIELAIGRTVSTPRSLAGDRVAVLATAGLGARALVLVAVGTGAELVAADGDLVDTFELRGTTPTITRVYTGEGTHHDNILEESPTWPVSAAIAEDGRWVAIGGSDSKVRLWDRKRGSSRELAYVWSYEERRHMGGNPDLNLPLDLRFVKGGRELLASYRHGEVIAWRTSDGRRVRTIRGTCSVAEATVEVNRFVPVGAPRQVPTAEDREGCGHATNARFSADASLVATVGTGVRVRDTDTGKGVAMLVEPELPTDMLAFGPDDRLAIANIHGRPRVWSREGGVAAPWGTGEPPSGPITPRLDASGRYLEFDLRRRWVVWDLEQGRDVSPVQREGEHTLAIAPDGSRLVAVGPVGGMQLRRRDGTVEWSRDVNDTTPGFIAGGKLVMSRYQGEVRVRELESGNEVVLADAGTGRRYAASADGGRLLFYDYNEPLRVYDTERGELLLVLDVRARYGVMAPDGSWIAWLEVPDDQRPETVACWRRIADPAERVIRIPVPGWAKLLAAAPGSDELLAVTESAIVRWRPQEGWQRPIEGMGYVSANEIRYSADGRLLRFEGYDRIDVRENADGLPRIGTLFPLLDGGWAVMSEDGALDGSETAPEHLMTVVEGTAGDVLLHGGTLGWDRYAVEGLWAQLMVGRRVAPAIEAAPRPVVK
jgi:hypothetical protein